MKTISSFSKKPLTIAVLLLAFLNLSCNQDDFVESYVDNSLSNKYSGEELFRNIVLLENKDIVNKIPQYGEIIDLLSTMSTDQEEELKEFNDEIVANIKSFDGTFFQEFQKMIYSKDIQKIESALELAGDKVLVGLSLSEKYNSAYAEVEKILNEVEKNPDISQEEMETVLKDTFEFEDIPQSEEAAALALVLAVTIVAAVLLAAAVTHAVAAAMVLVFAAAAVKNVITVKQGEQLSQELVVMSIYHNF